MNLTPEQKAIGKENFLAAVGSSVTRREFLKKSSQENLASGKGMGAYYFRYGEFKDPVKVAVLGTGDGTFDECADRLPGAGTTAV